MLLIRPVRMDPNQIKRSDPDPHKSDKLDPDPDPHQMTSQIVWNISLFEHFFFIQIRFLIKV